MRCADGGKIDTVLYSAACGALNSSECAGDDAPVRADPVRHRANPQSRRVLPGAPDRSRRPFISAIGRLQVKKIPRKLSQRFHDAKTGGMIAHGNLRRAMNADRSLVPLFETPYAPDDRIIAAGLLARARLAPEQDARIDRTATSLIDAIRRNDDRLGGVEDMLREFALSTKEGLALMVLAEALLRVPDAETADQFIEDKLGQGDFLHHETRSSALLVNASAWALGMSARVIVSGETPQGTLGRLAKRLGVPAVRAATRQAMRLMGSHFVLGETIEAALTRAQSPSAGAPRYSFDMLGEG